ncbi:MAG: hypothetical protein H6739_07820 [Alphaproteobacteria bacterium]|nr:hypothetical protein [Alphaproteobacteria bacterium]
MAGVEFKTWGPFAPNPPNLPAVVTEQAFPRDTRTLILGSDLSGYGSWDRQATENVVLELRLYGGQGSYLRRFALGQYQRVEVPCAAYRSFGLSLLHGTSSASPALVAIASTGEGNTSRDERVYYPQDLDAVAEWEVPPGARRVWSAVADAGWAWQTSAPGGAISIPIALAVGVAQDVLGIRVRNTTPVKVVWEIEL